MVGSGLEIFISEKMFSIRYFEIIKNRSDFIFLNLVFLTLPLYEAPKNLFTVAFVFLLLSRVFFQNDRIIKGAPWDKYILALASILWISPLFSDVGLSHNPFDSAPRWTLLALFVVLVGRLKFDRAEFFVCISILNIGGMLAVFDALVLSRPEGDVLPMLRSVGHPNHSSMYTLVMLATGLGALWSKQWMVIAIGVGTLIAVFVYLPYSQSITGAITILTCMFFNILLYIYRYGFNRIFICIALASIFLFLVFLTYGFSNTFLLEIIERFSGDNITSGRLQIARSALAVWNNNPYLGSGWFSFGSATSEDMVRAALAGQGKVYDDQLYFHLPHGHNLWITILIERGLVGLILINLLLFSYLYFLIPKSVAFKTCAFYDCMPIVVATTTVIGFIVFGLANTTMMNEHGQAGMAIISIVHAYLSGRESP